MYPRCQEGEKHNRKGQSKVQGRVSGLEVPADRLHVDFFAGHGIVAHGDMIRVRAKWSSAGARWMITHFQHLNPKFSSHAAHRLRVNLGALALALSNAIVVNRLHVVWVRSMEVVSNPFRWF